MPTMNPNIIRWARETAGLTVEEAAKALGIGDLKDTPAAERLHLLESGEVHPSRPLLLKMVKKYHRPLITFYLAEPPRTINRGEDFRSLPIDYDENDDSLLNVMLRDVLARQGLIRATMLAEEEGEILPFVGSLNPASSKSVIKDKICEVINFSLEEFRNHKNPDSAFKYLREKVETAGIFVLLMGNLGSHHTRIDVDIFRGYSLADQVAPFIVINDNDSHRAWSFTLIHELTHILLGQTGISAGYSGIKVEKLCNDVAGELLLPSSELRELELNKNSEFEKVFQVVSSFAANKNISNTMVAYRLLQLNIISSEQWTPLSDAYRSLWLERRKIKAKAHRENDGGPNYYTIRKHRVGPALLSTIKRFIETGSISTTKAGKVLGVKPGNVFSLIEAGIPFPTGNSTKE